MNTPTSRRGTGAKRSALVAVGLSITVAAGCGGGSDAGDDTIAPVDPRFSELPASGQQLVGAVITQDTPQHIEMGMGIEMNINGMSMGAEADPNNPIMVTDVDDDGDTHTVMDMSSLFESMGSIGGTGGNIEMPEMRAEQWSDGDWLYMDFTGFDELGDQSESDPAFADVLAPGIFKVDLNKLEEATDDTVFATEVLDRSTGQDVDITPFLYSLGANADEAQPDPEDPSKQRVETTLGELIEQNAGDSVPMLDDLTGTDDDPFGMAEAMNDMPVVYLYSTDDEGRIDDLTVEIDMSSLFAGMASMFGDMAELSSGTTEPETTDPMEDLTMKFSMPMTIGYESTGDIEMPADVTDDRTDAFIEALQETSAQAEAAADDAGDDEEDLDGASLTTVADEAA